MLKSIITMFFSCVFPCLAPVVVGEPAPDFSLIDDRSDLWSLKNHRGKVVVLYFYPSDGTPNCTAQACSLRNNYGAFKKYRAEVVGINYQSVAQHQKFKKSQHLPFVLLSDPKAEVAKMYGASRWWPNFVPKRKTIIIDQKGNVSYELDDVDVSTHTSIVFEYVKQLHNKDRALVL